MNRVIKIFSVVISLFFTTIIHAQDVAALVQKVKAKLDVVKDYVADGTMKTDVSFIKAPVGQVKIYYKKPNQFKLKRDGGISILPKGGVTVNMSSIVSTNDFVVIPAGDEMLNGIKTKKVKLLPRNDNNDVVITTMYIDEANLDIETYLEIGYGISGSQRRTPNINTCVSICSSCWTNY